MHVCIFIVICFPPFPLAPPFLPFLPLFPNHSSLPPFLSSLPPSFPSSLPTPSFPSSFPLFLNHSLPLFLPLLLLSLPLFSKSLLPPSLPPFLFSSSPPFFPLFSLSFFPPCSSSLPPLPHSPSQKGGSRESTPSRGDGDTLSVDSGDLLAHQGHSPPSSPGQRRRKYPNLALSPAQRTQQDTVSGWVYRAWHTA